jgi:hypothetical protein
MPWRDGRTWAYIYDPGRDAEEVIKQAYMMYLTENSPRSWRRRCENGKWD